MFFYIFSSFLILFKNYLHNFDEDILHLLVAFARSFATFGFVASSFDTSGSVGSHILIAINFSITNNLLLKLLNKLLKAFSLALNNNTKLFKRYFFKCFYTFIKIL